MYNKQIGYNLQPQVVDETLLFDSRDAKYGQHIQREGIVTIRPIESSPHKNEQLTFGGFKGFGFWDPGKTEKLWFGTVVGNNPDGSRKFKKINILDGRMYHLNNPEDAIEYNILRHHYSVKGSPNEFGKPRWKIDDDRMESRKNTNKASKFVDVYTFLNTMDDSRMKSFGRIFGLDPNNNPSDVIKGQLLAMAMENPDRFEPYMKDKEATATREVFHRAVATSVITFRLDRGYLFNDSVPLGVNEEMAIGNLLSNKDLLVSVDVMSRQRDNSLSSSEKNSIYTSPSKDFVAPIAKKTTGKAEATTKETPNDF